MLICAFSCSPRSLWTTVVFAVHSRRRGYSTRDSARDRGRATFLRGSRVRRNVRGSRQSPHHRREEVSIRRHPQQCLLRSCCSRGQAYVLHQAHMMTAGIQSLSDITDMPASNYMTHDFGAIAHMLQHPSMVYTIPCLSIRYGDANPDQEAASLDHQKDQEDALMQQKPSRLTRAMREIALGYLYRSLGHPRRPPLGYGGSRCRIFTSPSADSLQPCFLLVISVDSQRAGDRIRQ